MTLYIYIYIYIYIYSSIWVLFTENLPFFYRRKSNRFEMGWVYYDWIFIFGWTNPL